MSLRQDLINKGYSFSSQTDTEVFITFIEDIQKNNNCSLEKAVRLALNKVVGAYAIVIISEDLSVVEVQSERLVDRYLVRKSATKRLRSL